MTTLLDKWDLLQKLLADTTIPHPVKSVAARVLWHHNTADGRCDPSYGTLARGAGVNRRNAITYVATLADIGWLRIVSQGLRKRNRLVINWAWEAAKPSVTQPPASATTAPSPSAPAAPSPSVKSTLASDGLVQGAHYASVKGTLSPSVPATPKPCNDKQGKEPGNNIEGVTSLSSLGEPAPQPPKPKKAIQDYDADFTAWYAQYPRKKAPDKARLAYAKARKRATKEQLLEGVIRFTAERAGKDPEYTLYPATWLNSGCWDDEPTAPHQPSPTPGSKGEAIRAGLTEFLLRRTSGGTL